MTESVYPDRDGRVFFDLARDRLSVQLETLDAIDTKVGMLFSTATALLGILAAVLVLKAGKLNSWDYGGVTASVVAYLFVAINAWVAYRCREWNVGPELRSVWRTYTESTETDRELEWAAGNKLRKDYEANKKAAETKLDAMSRILPALVIQTLILVLTLVLVA
jgi:hypothetical protein